MLNSMWLNGILSPFILRVTLLCMLWYGTNLEFSCKLQLNLLTETNKKYINYELGL